VSSQALWQHPSNELFLALGALALTGALGRPRAAALSGAAFLAAAACRPTSALFAVGAAAWLFFRAFGVALAWSALLQVAGAFAYDVHGWNGAVEFRATRPSGEVVVLRDEVRARAEAAAGALVRLVSLDIDLRQNRDRLWSWSDSPIAHYLAHFGEGRRQRRELVARWIEQWTPATRIGD
jgi:hypothetical protein